MQQITSQINCNLFQDLNNCIIDKTELTSLIVGGDWNCTFSKKDKIGGTLEANNPQLPRFHDLEMFDLVDIQRVRHLKLREFT